jgi:hypothetical protein
MLAKHARRKSNAENVRKAKRGDALRRSEKNEKRRSIAETNDDD